MSERILAAVDALRRKHGTSDPFELIDALGIHFGYTSALRLKGYYVVQNRERFIRVNANLREKERRVVAAHELGHDQQHRALARVHPLRDTSLYNMSSKWEHQANLFASELLIPDRDVLDCVSGEMDYLSMCRTLSVDPDLMAFKIYSMLQRGYHVDVPQNLDSGFLRGIGSVVMPDKPIKVYVHVSATFDEAGQIRPRCVYWEDGRKYAIDKVLAVRPAAAERSGGQGDRYTVRINGQESYLYFEHNPVFGTPVLGRWFVERKIG